MVDDGVNGISHAERIVVMSESRAGPERIDLEHADDLRDVVHRAVACLAGGGIVGLPTEAGYALASSTLQLAALDRLRSISTAEVGRRVTLLLRSEGEAADWAFPLTELGCRFARRAWPGPVALVVPAASRDRGLTSRLPESAKAILIHGDKIALRVPSDGFLREVIRLSPGPIATLDFAARSVDGATWDVSRPDVATLDMVIDAGRKAGNLGATFVSIDEDRWNLDLAGAVPESEIAAMAGTILLFVCTGNTCRSPMAEALCKAMLAKRLGCHVDALVERGYVVISAGVAASDGTPAASHAIDAMASRGGSLKRHASRRATDALIRQADLIFALASEHLEVVLDHVPDVAEKVRLLHPEGFDILDPIGSDLANYLETAREIEDSLSHVLDELGLD